jgi:UDP-GlcNAc:undecaprenyl-phosphate GlcNAc-1-phosphate transferase
VDFLFAPLTVACLLLFLWGASVTPLSIILSNRYLIVDQPGERKIHMSATPRGAGIVLWLGFLLWSLYAVEGAPLLRFLSIGGTFVFLSGYWDDMKTLNPAARLLVHILSAGIFLLFLPVPLRHIPICLLWITGMTNAFNLIDGANGLCLMMFITASVIVSLLGFPLLLPPSALAAGVLFWNFPRARTFLGDGGTTLLGYLFATLFLYSAAPFLDEIFVLQLPFLLFFAGGVPVLDTLFAIIRRMARKKSPFVPDRGHIHHRMLDKGFGPVTTVILLSFAQICIVSGGTFFFGRILF